MSRLRALAKGASVTGVASIALGGVAYGIERLVAARIRRGSDDDLAGIASPYPYSSNHVVTSDGSKLTYIDTGGNPDEPTVVLSHGVTLNIRTWVRQVNFLHANGCRVIVFNHRGHGDSTLGSSGFGVDHIGDDVYVLLHELDLHDVVLVGHSMGGVAVQSYLARHANDAADRVAGIVLLSTLPSALSGSQAARMGQIVERVTRRTPDSTRLWANPHLGLVLARFGFGRDPRPSDVELVRQMMLACDPTTRVAGPRSLIGFNLVEELAAIALPTLVIGGTADVITPERDSRRMHAAIANSKLAIFEGGGHMLMLERFEPLNEMLLAFVRELQDFSVPETLSPNA